jgi:GT2 family glycosyltransferase
MCLRSLRDHSGGIGLEVVAVDNNSSDGSQEYIRREFPEVRLIANRENIGFSRANNLGISETRGDYLLFLNTDTAVTQGALSSLLQELRENPSTGAIGPALFRKPNVYQVSFGKKVSFVSQFLQKYFKNFYFALRLKASRRKREVHWLSAACLLVRRSALEEAGYFDENFFLYFEDIDLCRRMRQLGWKLVYLPQAAVFHEGGATTAPRGLRSRLEYRRSQLYFYRKHNSALSLFCLRLYLYLNFHLLFFRAMKKEKNPELRKLFFSLLKEEARGHGQS